MNTYIIDDAFDKKNEVDTQFRGIIPSTGIMTLYMWKNNCDRWADYYKMDHTYIRDYTPMPRNSDNWIARPNASPVDKGDKVRFRDYTGKIINIVYDYYDGHCLDIKVKLDKRSLDLYKSKIMNKNFSSKINKLFGSKPSYIDYGIKLREKLDSGEVNSLVIVGIDNGRLFVDSAKIDEYHQHPHFVNTYRFTYDGKKYGDNPRDEKIILWEPNYEINKATIIDYIRKLFTTKSNWDDRFKILQDKNPEIAKAARSSNKSKLEDLIDFKIDL